MRFTATDTRLQVHAIRPLVVHGNGRQCLARVLLSRYTGVLSALVVALLPDMLWWAIYHCTQPAPCQDKRKRIRIRGSYGESIYKVWGANLLICCRSGAGSTADGMTFAYILTTCLSGFALSAPFCVMPLLDIMSFAPETGCAV